MRVYLNTNIYCRPFDDLNQRRILDEAKASLNLLLLSASKIIEIVSSEMVLAEISLIESAPKKDAVELLLVNSVTKNYPINSNADVIAGKIRDNCGIKDYADCLHLAMACTADCEYYITCDDELIDKCSVIEHFTNKLRHKLKIKNPIEFWEELEVK